MKHIATNNIKISVERTDHRGRALLFWQQMGEIPFFMPFLASLSALYKAPLYLRKMAYCVGAFPIKILPCPVISVGNLTVGGTGKTPVVKMLAVALLNRGFHPAILSRGYKRKGKEDLIVVSNGESILDTPEVAGDEPYMLAQWLPKVPVIVCADRFRAGIFAYSMFGVDCFILDDGFQHLRIYRDLDILVINARDPFGGGRLLPWGRLREPLSGMKRASVVLINKSGPDADLSFLTQQIQTYNAFAPIFTTTYLPDYLVAASDHNQKIPLIHLYGKSIVTFSGIADPGAFSQQLKNLGASIKKEIIFNDHHWFSRFDMSIIKKMADSAGTNWIVTTEKDGVRLPKSDTENIYLLKMKMCLKEDAVTWEDIIRSILRV